MGRSQLGRRGYQALLFAACLVQFNACSSGDGALGDEQGGAPSSAGGYGGTVAKGGSANGESGAGGSSTFAGGRTSTGGSRNDAGASGDAGAAGIAGVGGDSSTSSGGLASGGSASAMGGADSSSGGSHAHLGGATGSGGMLANGGAPASGGAPSAAGGAVNATGGGGSANGGTGAGGVAASCIYHTDADATSGGEGGEGGGPSGPTITVQKNGFAGSYLADGKGRALYIYGADAPGDCKNPPITNCFNDCLVAWPAFQGSPRVLAAGLDDALFGSITRDDGFVQGTYRGWPLYYYKSDVAPGDVKGQAVGKIWQLAQVVLPNIELMRSGNTRFLGDGDGYALYASSADTLGTPSSPPVSACTGACLEAYPMFVPPYASPVSYLNVADFSYFARSDGRVQLAYKGAPLYRSRADTRAGTMNGVSSGWVLVAP